jgi:ethanolamine ammonia-lyase small subunit
MRWGGGQVVTKTRKSTMNDVRSDDLRALCGAQAAHSRAGSALKTHNQCAQRRDRSLHRDARREEQQHLVATTTTTHTQSPTAITAGVSSNK